MKINNLNPYFTNCLQDTTALAGKVKRPGDIQPFLLQPIESPGGIGGRLRNDLYLMIFNCPPQGTGHPHISGVSGTDDQNFRPGGQNILNIV